MSNRLSSQLDNLESQLGKTLHSAPGIEPTHPPSTSSPSVLNGTRHSSLYLTDGNLVVAAEGAGGKVLFRVHQSILSLQSPVFSSMFTLPHPGGSANRDMYDGAPFVHMQDDAKDVEALLKVLYNPSELPYKRLDPLTPINVRRTLGMATKYGMEPLRDRIVAQLEADWPNSLAEWDRLETEVHALTKEHKSSEGFMVDGLYLDERLPEPGSAIRLAIDWSIPKILPAAFYHLSRLSTDADWLECRKPRENLCLSRTVRWDLLQASDLKLLLKLREAITGYESLYTTPSKLCHSSQVCDDWWDQTCLRWDHAKDPLDSMKRFVETRPTRGLCKPCWNATKDAVQQRRLELWDEICDCVEEHTK
ncbi:hypothetical protein DFH09DRAFT_902459 [Mycena vulgaris]|nr:hypothetical protein DFH09DRAFT_902459 [Mycena vulgaris]